MKTKKNHDDPLLMWAPLHQRDRAGTPGGDEALDRAALAAGYVPGVSLHRRPADWDRYHNGAGPIRNRAMAAECKAVLDAGGVVEGLALGALVKPNGSPTGTGDMVALLRALGVRVRWVPAPDAEAVWLPPTGKPRQLRMPGL